ncbi:MAG: S8 family peptidase, partial [Kiloniellaceae bacterium]
SGDRLAEFRRAKETAGYWLDLDNQTQAEWVEDLLSRLSVDQSTNTWVCVLDTGANNGHQLLRAVLAVGDCHTLDPSWGTDDAEGHGTAICGLAAFGEELDWLLQSGEELTLRHRLESVKLIPRIGHHHDKELYGLRTQQSVARAEIEAPERNRVVCTAVSSEDERDKGRPSSWSGAIDALASGMDDDKQRLIIVSAGTIHDSSEWTGYPESNLTNAVHDPGQSWNALTVGACTAKTLVRDTANYGNYAPIAQKDQLSPFSTTSTIWEDKWPNKPDIVVEGGNAGIDSSGFATEIEDLSLLTTNCDPQEAQFAHANATSAASAIAAHMAAQIQAQYPNAWPETVRALLVHSASWSDGLKNQFWDLSKTEKQNFRQLLRICGYGVPGLERAMESAANHLTLVAQESLQPFQRKEQGRAYETRDMHLHQLPWPEAALLELPPGTPVSIKVTLSYFVEPGPGEVGWKDKYLYRSHGLDFDINGPTESEDEFRARINKAARGEEHESGGKSVPWMIGGYGGRKRGSVHSDIWETTAIQAAECNLIGIYPTIGWWKERQHLERGESRTRYSLIVSVWTPMQDVDIYTPVSIAIRPAIEIATS